MSIRARVLLALLAGVLALVAGCDGGKKGPDVTPVTLTWQEVTLPVPPGNPGRLALRDVVVCGGTWFLTGGVIVTDEDTRPAVWTSTDGQSWRLLNLDAKSFYGKQSIVYAAACRDGKLAMIGAKSGGAHGNPRVSTWYQQGDTMIEVQAAFTLYGGSEAVNVSRMVGGPKGWLIAGNRISGAAAWVSPDATDFKLIQGAPNLSSDPGMDTADQDGIATEQGWMLVGGGLTTGHIDHDPLVWTSADGAQWQRVALPHDTTYEELQRVVQVGDRFVALGLHGSAFGAWRGDPAKPDSWQSMATFGAEGNNGLGDVRSAAVAGTRVLATGNLGVSYGLWVSADTGESWRSVELPAGAHPSGSERTMAVSASGDTVVMVGDDAHQGRIWMAHYSR